MKVQLKSFILTISMVGVCLASRADPITFWFSGLGSGSLGGASFNDADFNFQFVADTINLSHINPNTPAYSEINGTITVAGVTSSLEPLPGFSGPYYVFNNQNSPQGIPTVGFGGQYYDYLGITASGVGLETYGLNTSFGPISGSIVISNYYDMPTSSGVFHLDTASDITFQSVEPSPEPSPVGIFLVGATALSAYFWRTRERMRRRKSDVDIPPSP